MGLGSTVAVDSGDLDSYGLSIVGELTASSPLAKVGLEGSLDLGTLCPKVTLKAQIGQGTFDLAGKAGTDVTPMGPGLEGKFAVKACLSERF